MPLHYHFAAILYQQDTDSLCHRTPVPAKRYRKLYISKRNNVKPTTLDCLGLPCPQPVIQTKDALESGAPVVEVLVDNEASQNNILRFAKSRGCDAEAESTPEGNYKITVHNSGEPSEKDDFDPAAYQCSIPPQKHLIYVISADVMGKGSEELGWALLQTFIQTIKDVTPLPQKILFYNSGVRLVTEESGALGALLALQKQGVEILVCGTCLDFYRLQTAIKVGQISNMYDIMNAMAEADQVISPH
ncbi:sulfurtransferase-like selenium metabolism protein YedF [Desulfogranum japonicum]|uniref:sulfurtransferase-like selenium metabolism protein YedF n=1 Tax=Desulfogranum japonicum TaxID=231447 RepID=UPI000685B924|nr:sulfurtransferase-like selenium metabolism protein YedF [Desulfogranum japonicum]